jgi:hypothetical protein
MVGDQAVIVFLRRQGAKDAFAKVRMKLLSADAWGP